MRSRTDDPCRADAFTPPLPPVPPSTSDEAQPAIVVDTLVEVRANVPRDHDQHMVQAIGWSLALLALLNAVPVAIVLLRPQDPGATHLERWALGILLLGILQLCYAIYLLQVPDWSSARVVSFVTLGIATRIRAHGRHADAGRARQSRDGVTGNGWESVLITTRVAVVFCHGAADRNDQLPCRPGQHPVVATRGRKRLPALG